MAEENNRIEGTVPPGRLDAAIAETATDLSRERVKALIAEGRLQIDGRTVAAGSSRKYEGMVFTLDLPPPVPIDLQPENIPLDVVFEDAHLIVIDKPAGLVVHPAPGHPGGTLVNALLFHCAGSLSGIGGEKRPGIVHRIDKDTSGLMVAAKSDLAHRGLAALFKAHDIDRHYLAITDGVPMPLAGKVDAPLGRAPTDRKKMAVVEPGQGKEAVTHYAVRQGLRSAALVDCTLETGRTHQVRVHMAHIGHPLIGDPLYGRRPKKSMAAERKAFSRQALHAAVLGFIHPITAQKLRFESPIPSDMQELFRALRV
ncbi:RluA family pseudouridine synthase [Novosphingopyxis sp.]|uniref:RluA family pseudouridine synthase n=1 Tax=Novosphingopyxis sp. TaxID=2709690 RepID=UPI003B5A7DBD